MTYIYRETWGKAAKEDLPGVRVIFVLGMPSASGRGEMQVRITYHMTPWMHLAWM